MDPNLRRELILDHYQNPVHRGLIEDEHYLKQNTNNESCIDNIDISVKIEDNHLTDIRFDGEACAISTSATSMMIATFLNHSLDEVKNMITQYENMIEERPYDKEVLGELNAYDEIYLQPNRKTCALLPMNAMKKIIEQYEAK